MNFQLPTTDLQMIAPQLVLAGTALLLLIVEAFGRGGRRQEATWISLIGLIGAGAAVVTINASTTRLAFSGMVVNDKFTVFAYVVFISIGILATLVAHGYLNDEHNCHGEFHALMMMSLIGMMFMASAGHLMMTFVALETMSIAVYAMAGFMRTKENLEASFKYFILGGFASAFMLYGIALVYGAVGSTHLRLIAQHILSVKPLAESPMLLAGIALLLVGFGFKVAAVPFHGWTPDVYQGAPTPVTAFMATGVKAAAFAAFFRVFALAFPGVVEFWSTALWVVAVATMTVGNFAAIAQRDIKRMLAYSSIAHAGYLLVGVITATPEAGSGILYYLFAYAFMNIGAFACLIAVSRKGDEGMGLDDIAGIGFKYPLIAASLTLFMFSMAGIPPTAGFIGKFMIFKAAINKGYIWLAVLGVLNSAASVYFYLRVIVYMYFKERPEGAVDTVRPFPTLMVATGLAAAAILIFGIMPGPLVKLATAAIAGF